MKNDYHFPKGLSKPKGTVKLESETLRIPCNETLSNPEVKEVINKIKEFFNREV